MWWAHQAEIMRTHQLQCRSHELESAITNDIPCLCCPWRQLNRSSWVRACLILWPISARGCDFVTWSKQVQLVEGLISVMEIRANEMSPRKAASRQHTAVYGFDQGNCCIWYGKWLDQRASRSRSPDTYF